MEFRTSGIRIRRGMAAAVASSEEHYASSRKSHYPNFALSEFVQSKFTLAEYFVIFFKPRNSGISH